MILKNYDELKLVRQNHPDKEIVYVSGIFDLTHAGHLLFFEKAKSFGDILVVAIGSDNATSEYKGLKRPIINENARVRMIDGLKPVDYVFINQVSELYDLNNIFSQLNPDTYVVNSDAYKIDERKPYASKHNVRIEIVDKNSYAEFKGMSTSALIRKIQDL